MATTRLLRASRTTALAVASPSPSSSSSSSFSTISRHTSCSANFSTRLNKVGSVDGEKLLARTSGGGGERKSAVVTSAVATSENALITKTHTGSGGVDLAFLVDMIKTAGIASLKVVTRKRPWRFIVQMFIEKVIIDCRFFTMLAVAGSLLGSVLCFLEGCFMIGESYLQYFQAISQGSDQGHVVHLLIEAIDMFLIGTAMLIFGMGLHMMFVGSRNLNGKGSPLPPSNFFGLFYLRKLPSWVGIGSITEAKSKIGHALMMILQVGVLEKFKSIPMASGLDLACFAGAVFVSSACIFLLSKLSLTASTAHH